MSTDPRTTAMDVLMELIGAPTEHPHGVTIAEKQIRKAARALIIAELEAIDYEACNDDLRQVFDARIEELRDHLME